MLVSLGKKIFIGILVLALSSTHSLAQQQAQGQSEIDPKMISTPKQQLAKIVFAGLGGMILGLSTLSFYGRPQEKLENIAVGFALGVIAGTVIVTYGAATRPQEVYSFNSDDLIRMNTRGAYEASGDIVRGITLNWEF